MKREYEVLNDVEMDFSKYEETSLSEMERVRMKRNLKENSKRYRIRTTMTKAAACAAVLLVFSQTTFAQNVLEQIISIGHSSVVVEDGTPGKGENDAYPIPEELVGQIFDKDGKVLTQVSADTTEIYDKDGDAVMICSGVQDGTEIYSIEKVDDIGNALEEDDSTQRFDTEEELAQILNFELKVPKTLPDGYTLTEAYGFTDENGEVSPDYAVLVYGNGEKQFSIHERRDSEETKFTTGMTDAQVMDFDGVDAVYTDTEFECSWDGVIVSIMGQKAISGEALLDVARAMK